jgi:hypothetical protein
MVIQPLTQTMISVGEAVLRRLDRTGFKATVALWLYEPESVGWRFVLAAPGVRRQGPRWAYGKILRAIRSVEASGEVFTLDNLTAKENTDPFIRALRKAVKTKPGISGVRYTRNAIDGHFIEDAYIYRVR